MSVIFNKFIFLGLQYTAFREQSQFIELNLATIWRGLMLHYSKTVGTI
jgi:hypothetical protein